LKIVFAGTPANAATTLNALVANPLIEVVAVLTRPDAPVGRKRVVTASPVAMAAAASGILTIKAKKITEDVAARLSDLQAELGVVVAFGSIFDEQALKLFKKGWLNVHYSLLPDWRGAAPVQNALIQGDTVTGVTLFQLDAGMDTGPIYLQIPTVIEPGENAEDLLTRLTALGISGLGETLPRVAADLVSPIAQNADGSERLANKPTRESSRIDFTEQAISVEHLIRGSNPQPMAWTELQSEPFRILDARATAIQYSESLNSLERDPGRVWLESGRVLVSCGAGTTLELRQVQPISKKPMTAADWFRGLIEPEKVTFK